MAASYPGSVKTFSTKVPGEKIASSHINDLQNEVVAIETQLGVNAGTWQSYTPTVTASEGTLTTASGSGSYVKIGKLIVLQATIGVTDKGTGTGGLYFSLPIAPSGITQGVGFDYGGSGKKAMVLVNGSPALIVNIDDTASVFDGATYYVTVTYGIA